MKYLSVCSGIEAATVAWHPLGWRPFAFAEIEKFPSAVLAHHYPSIPNLGDMTKFKDWPDANVNVLVGGTPCQSFSVAGLRQGLADPRGNLCLTFLAIADKYRPEWLLWENVPGVLSSDEGRDFGAFLGGLGQLGYGWSYRVLDAQYVRVDGFGRAVPQRRRRVFVVGNLRDWRRSAAVLFERESLQGHSPPRRETGQRVAPTISARTKGGGGLGTDFDCDGGLVHCADVASTLNAAFGDKQGLEDQHINSDCPLFVTYATDGQSNAAFSDDLALSLCATNEAPYIASGPIAFDTTQITSKANRSAPKPGDACHPLAAGAHAPALAFDMRGREGGAQFEGPHETANIRAASGGSSRSYVAQSWAVRRLTPVECERLQGFPDEYTMIPWRGKNGSPDGPRYKALGNSMAVNAMRWLGRRIHMVNGL